MSADRPILLVEDDENDILLFQRAAREAGIQNAVSVARDGQEAIDYLAGHQQFADRNRFPLPGLLLLDIKMPRKTGLDVLEWLSGQPHLRLLPVIMFTSSPRSDDVAQAYRLGANAFVVKPSSFERRNELARVIKVFWLEFNHLPTPDPVP
jgi:CheY-like chemotaxis protein